MNTSFWPLIFTRPHLRKRYRQRFERYPSQPELSLGIYLRNLRLKTLNLSPAMKQSSQVAIDRRRCQVTSVERVVASLCDTFGLLRMMEEIIHLFGEVRPIVLDFDEVLLEAIWTHKVRCKLGPVHLMSNSNALAKLKKLQSA